MNIKKYLKVLPVVVALLLTSACGNEDNEIIEAPQPAQARTVPFTVTVNSGSGTRATLDGNSYKFQTTDKLYVWETGGKIYGALSWVSGENGNTYNGSFTGTLTVESGGNLISGSTILNAVIKSENDQILGTLAEFKTNNFQPTYTPNIATSNADAVQKFSNLSANSTYLSDGNTSFNFYGGQHSSFLSFDITLEDGTDAGSNVDVTINNGGSAVRTGSVTTEDVGGVVHAKFVAGFPSSTTLSSATVKLGDRDAISFGGTKELAANKFYNVAKTYTRYKITATGTLTVTSPFSINWPINETKSNIALPYNSTLGDILGNKIDDLTKFEKKSGDITFGAFDSSKWGNTTVSITNNGETAVITVAGAATVSKPPVYNGSATFSDSDITLTVSKMTPAD